MADFKLHYSQYNCEVSSSEITNQESKQSQTHSHSYYSPQHPRLQIHRQRAVVVELQHRQRDIYSVLTAFDEEEGPSGEVVEERERLLGRSVIHLGDDNNSTGLDYAKVLAAFAALNVKSSHFDWDAIIDRIMFLLQRPDHQQAVITVDFVSIKIYRCVEEVDESC